MIRTGGAVLDAEGNLFGVVNAVNVVDALVVISVFTVVAAGFALVLGPSDSPISTTTNATVDLGPQSPYVADAIATGDTFSPSGNSALTITDVHRAPQSNLVRVIILTELRGPADGEALSYASAPLRLNRTLKVATDRYVVHESLTAVGGTENFDDGTTTVAIRGTAPTAEARDIAVGDRIRSGEETVATVTVVGAYPAANSSHRAVFVEAELDSYTRDSERYYAGDQLRRGQTVWLPAEGYTIDGTVQHVDGGLDRTETDVLLRSTVDAGTADRLSAGDVTTVAGHDTAEVETVTTYTTRDPDRKRVFVGVSLATVDVGTGPKFGDTAVRRRNTVSLSTESYDITGTIRRVDALEQRGDPGDRTVTLHATRVTRASPTR